MNKLLSLLIVILPLFAIRSSAPAQQTPTKLVAFYCEFDFDPVGASRTVVKVPVSGLPPNHKVSYGEDGFGSNVTLLYSEKDGVPFVGIEKTSDKPEHSNYMGTEAPLATRVVLGEIDKKGSISRVFCQPKPPL